MHTRRCSRTQTSAKNSAPKSSKCRLAAASAITGVHSSDAHSNVGLAELGALDELRRLIKADAERFVPMWSDLLVRQPDTPLEVADAVLSRRGDLSKLKKSLLQMCTQAHTARQAEVTAEWAAGRRAERPGASDNAFAAAFAAGSELSKKGPQAPQFLKDLFGKVGK